MVLLHSKTKEEWSGHCFFAAFPLPAGSPRTIRMAPGDITSTTGSNSIRSDSGRAQLASLFGCCAVSSAKSTINISDVRSMTQELESATTVILPDSLNFYLTSCRTPISASSH